MAGSGFLTPVETVKNKRQVLPGNTASGIADTNSYIRILRTEGQSNRAAGRGMAHGVFKQVFDNPLDHGDVGVYERQTGIEVDFYAELLFLGRQIKFLHHVMGQFADVKRFIPDLNLMGVQFCQLEKLIDQFAEPLTVLDGDLEMMDAIVWGQAFILI